MSNSATPSHLSQRTPYIHRRGERVRTFAVIYCISVIVTLLSAFALRQFLRWALT
jgi:hypothetical protein